MYLHIHIQEVATSEEVVASWEFFGTELQEMVMGRGFRGCDGKVHTEELGLDVVVSGEGIVPEKELETFMWGGGVDELDVGATLSQDAFVSDEELETEDSQIVKGGGMKEFETGGTYLNVNTHARIHTAHTQHACTLARTHARTRAHTQTRTRQCAYVCIHTRTVLQICRNVNI